MFYGAFILTFCFIQPPFEIPDEPAHFYRAAQISHFDFIPHFITGTPSGGAVLPSALYDLFAREMSPQIRTGRVRNARDRLARIRSESEAQRPVSITSFVDLPNEVIYHPLYYLPQAIAIAVTRAFTDRVYIWFYADRLFNALSAVVLIGLALWLSREQQFVLASAALLPMSISQIASASPDAWQIAVMILFVSLCIRLRERGEIAAQWLAVVAGIWLISARPVFLGAVLLAPLCSYGRLGWRRVFSLSAAIGVPAVALTLAWSHVAARAYSGTEIFWHSNPSGQMTCLLQRPLRIVPILINTFNREHVGVYRGFIGKFGWTAVEMPEWFYVCAPILLVLLFAVFVSPRKIWSVSGAVAAAGFLSIAGATLLSMYLLFTPPCIETVYGLQGRYFLAPMALAALVCGRDFKHWRERYLLGASLAIALMALSFRVSAFETYNRYYPHPIAGATAMPGGHIELPVARSHVEGRIQVSGWSAATSPVETVTVSVDGQDQLPLHCDIARPDVDRAVSGAAPGDKGWKIVLDTSAWKPGKHVIAARAATRDGQSASLGSLEVTR